MNDVWWSIHGSETHILIMGYCKGRVVKRYITREQLESAWDPWGLFLTEMRIVEEMLSREKPIL